MREVLKERREPLGPSSRSRVAGSFGSGDRVVYNFEKGKGGPEYDKLDDFFAAYAEVIETSPLDLWRDAIQRAEAEAARLAEDLGQDGDRSAEIRARGETAAARRARRRGRPVSDTDEGEAETG